ncbi:MAG: thermonuclease family protein [Candidatus Omnitrophica bacterium]|nr:thermonuclease family protein [Candidatus Omnitrophota bacterium]
MKRIPLFILLVLFSGVNFSGPEAAENELLKKLSSDYDHVLVDQVKDTATIILAGGEKVGLIGLKGMTPPPKPHRETERDEQGKIVAKEVIPFDSLEEEAFDFVQSLLEGQYVRLEFDVQRKGEDFQTWAYVFISRENEEIFVNAEILRQGFASLSIRPPNTKYAEKLREAYQEARQEKRGLQGE